MISDYYPGEPQNPLDLPHQPLSDEEYFSWASTNPASFTLDIETDGDRETATILSIALVADFVTETRVQQFAEEYLIDHYYAEKQDKATLNWWHQPKQIQTYLDLKERREKEGVSLADALQRIALTVAQSTATKAITEGCRPDHVHQRMEFWCKGTDFDIAILEREATRAGVGVPWKYWQVRDLRTLMKRLPYVSLPVPSDHVPHSALSDAVHQHNNLAYFSYRLQQFHHYAYSMAARDPRVFNKEATTADAQPTTEPALPTGETTPPPRTQAGVPVGVASATPEEVARLTTPATPAQTVPESAAPTTEPAPAASTAEPDPTAPGLATTTSAADTAGFTL